MSGTVYASTDGETYVKIGDITGDPKTEVYLDFSSAFAGKEYCWIKITNATASPLYIQGAAITFEKMITGINAVTVETPNTTDLYDLQGRKVGSGTRGLVIENGHLHYRR
jgi:hypothetical protein